MAIGGYITADLEDARWAHAEMGKTTTTTDEIARATVACYRDEFPGEGPDWASDWWAEAWTIDTANRVGAPDFAAYLAACKAAWATTPGHDGIGGHLTHDLEDARREHAERGGYLLQIGDRPASYAVCDESEAIEAWGRTPEQLAALEPSYSEV